MTRFERRLLFAGLTLALLAATIWTAGGGRFTVPTAHACIIDPDTGQCITLAYYGANLSTGMYAATGVTTSNTVAANGPWPQRAGNYCFLAAIQAVTNYADWHAGQSIRYPTQWYQGPPSSDGVAKHNGDPSQEQSGQILYDMDHLSNLVANFSPGQRIVNNYGGTGPQYRRPFTLANTSHDGGGDPRAIAATIYQETPSNHYYHQYIYHYSQSNVSMAVAGFAYAVDAYDEPVVEFVNGGLHAVVVAGVWSYGDPITEFPAAIDSIAVYNPWNQGWGTYLNGAYYSRVTYDDWIGMNYSGSFWWAHAYDWNGSGYPTGGTTYDPDPYMGIYQAGTDPVTHIQSANPTAKHWVGWFVSIERDGHTEYNENYSYNENDQAMGGP